MWISYSLPVSGTWMHTQFYLLGFYFHVAFFYHLTHITVSQSVGVLDQVRFVLIWNSNNFRYFIYLMKREIYGNERKRCDECNHASAHVKKNTHTSNRDTRARARAAVWIWNVRWYRMIGCEIHTQTHTHWMLKKITTPNFNRFGTLIIYLISQHIVAVFGRISFRISLEPNEIWLNFILFYFYLSNISRCQFESQHSIQFWWCCCFHFFNPVEVRWFFTYSMCNTSAVCIHDKYVILRHFSSRIIQNDKFVINVTAV